MNEEMIESHTLGEILSPEDARRFGTRLKYFFVSLSYRPTCIWWGFGALAYTAADFLTSNGTGMASTLNLFLPWMLAIWFASLFAYELSTRNRFRPALSFLDAHEYVQLGRVAAEYPKVKEWIDQGKGCGHEPRYKDLLGALEYKLIKESQARQDQAKHAPEEPM